MSFRKIPAATIASAGRSGGRRAVRPNVREQQFENRCQRFVEVAQELFLERGFAGTSVNEIVRRAGGSLATLYAEYGTKDELFEAVMNRRAAAMFTNIIHSKTRIPDISGELLALAKRMQAHMLSEDALAVYRLAVHEGPKFPSVRRTVLANGLKAFLQRLSDYFAELSSSGRIQVAEPAIAAELFLTLVQGQLRTIAAFGDGERLSRKWRAEHVQRAVDAFLCVYPPVTKTAAAA
ncbi:MAG: TetR/AcrR family transcriptional regulator [Betaproteobacteria bacterium]